MSDQLDIFDQDIAGLEEEEAAVWRVIREHRGKANAAKVDAVAWRTGIPGVKVREVVSRLVRAQGKLIASSTGNPPGFFVITSKEELEKHVRSLRHRGIMCLVRAAELGKTSVEEIFKQGRLEIDASAE